MSSLPDQPGAEQIEATQASKEDVETMSNEAFPPLSASSSAQVAAASWVKPIADSAASPQFSDAVSSSSASVAGDANNASSEDPFSRREQAKCDVLVADTGAFIKNAQLEQLAKRVVTIREVVGEIRDEMTRLRMEALPYEIEYRMPSAEAVRAVTQFSKLTGDFHSLSVVDLRLLALAYMMEVEINGKDHIRTKPRPTRQIAPGSILKPCRYGQACRRKHVCWYQHPDDDEVTEEDQQRIWAAQAQSFGHTIDSKQDDESGERRASNVAEAPSGSPGDTKAAPPAPSVDETESSKADKEDGDEEAGDWITPSNLNEFTKKLKLSEGVSDEHVKVGCMTTDFSMQNVLMQMGLTVVSVDGYRIRRVKTFTRRCHACFETTHDQTKVFCPSCGNATLVKVPITVDESGNVTVTPTAPKRPMLRGTKFSIPLPKGGRNPGIVLREDQLKTRRKKKEDVDVFSDDYAFAAQRKINYRGGRMPTSNGAVVGPLQRDPNRARKTRKGKRNK